MSSNDASADKALNEDLRSMKPLVLRRCTTFWARLRGMHGMTRYEQALMLKGALYHQGIYLRPCRAVHTLGMCMGIDVVFMDAALNELKRVDRLPRNRLSVCWSAEIAVELPGGYCQRHADYLCRIKAALSN